MKKPLGVLIGVVLFIMPVSVSAQTYTDSQKASLIAALQQLVVILTEQLHQLLTQQKEVLTQQSQILNQQQRVIDTMTTSVPSQNNPSPVTQTPSETVYDTSIPPTVLVTNKDLTLPTSPTEGTVIGSITFQSPDYTANVRGIDMTTNHVGLGNNLLLKGCNCTGTLGYATDFYRDTNFWFSKIPMTLDIIVEPQVTLETGDYVLNFVDYNVLRVASSTSSSGGVASINQSITFHIK